MSENFTKTIERLKLYIDLKGYTFNQLATSIGVSNSYFSKMVKSKGSLGEDIIKNILLFYDDINPEWFILGEGPMLKSEIQSNKPNKTSDRITIASEQQVEYTSQENKIQKLKAIIPDHQKPDNNLVSISMLEIYGAAGHGYMNDEKLIPTGVIDLPKSMLHSSGLRYCIRIKGHSMAPTLQDNDFLVIRHLDPGEWRSMSDEHVYLIVDKDGMAYVKRVKNRLSKGFIVLMSDSIEKRDYPNFNLQADEIASIFYAEWHFSAKMQNINEAYYDRLKTLEDRVDNIENSIKQ